MAFKIANKIISGNVIKNFSKTLYSIIPKNNLVVPTAIEDRITNQVGGPLPSTSSNRSHPKDPTYRAPSRGKRSYFTRRKLINSRKRSRYSPNGPNRNYSSTDCSKPKKKCPACPPPCAPPRCPKFPMPGCSPRVEGIRGEYIFKPCQKVNAPYPAYSETCHTILDESPSECKMCPWKPHDHPTYIIIKRKYHTKTSNFVRSLEENDKKIAKPPIELSGSNCTLLRNLKRSLLNEVPLTYSCKSKERNRQEKKIPNANCTLLRNLKRSLLNEVPLTYSCKSKERNRQEKKIPRCGKKEDDDPCKLKRKGTIQECPTDLLVKKRRKPPKPVPKE